MRRRLPQISAVAAAAAALSPNSTMMCSVRAFSLPTARATVGTECAVERRQALRDILIATCGIATSSSTGSISPADAANLPTSTGADFSKTGTIDTLMPVVNMLNALLDAKAQILQAKDQSEVSASTIKSISSILSKIPAEQTLFKRKFDEYSDPVSYKQRFMDQNAFLVYYTKGFDGPNRPPMESSGDPVPKQTVQYGLRNDAWAAFDDLLAELSFFSESTSSISDILEPLERTIASFDAYLSFAPAADLEEARQICRMAAAN